MTVTLDRRFWLTSFFLSVNLAVAQKTDAQVFMSPAYGNGRIPSSATSFRPEWTRDLELVVGRSSPKLVDISGNDDLEVIVGSLSGWLHVLDPRTGAPMPGWPQYLGAPIDTTVAVGNVDEDPAVEIVATCGSASDGSVPAGSWTARSNGAIYVFNTDGSLVLRHTTTDWLGATGLGADGFSEAVIANPALGDLDGDGILEIVVGATDHLIYAINATGGAVHARWDGSRFQSNANVPPPFQNSVWRFDLDNDGRYDEDPPGDNTPHPFPDNVSGHRGVDEDGDGKVDESHPSDDDEDSDRQGNQTDMNYVDEDPYDWPRVAADSVWGSAAICDFDGDGSLDVAVPADYSGEGRPRARLHLVNREAKPLQGFASLDLPQLVWTPTSVGDVDGDGHPEMFMGTNSWWDPVSTAWGGGLIYGIRHNAAEIRDGDFDSSTFGVFATTHPRPSAPPPGQAPYVMGAPSIGQLDADPQLEIVAADANFLNGGLYAWNHDGSLLPGFPIESTNSAVNWGPVMGGTVLADIDGDGDTEILFVTAHAFLVGYHHDGTSVAGTPFFGIDFEDGRGPQWTGAFTNTPAVGDIDADGKVEIVFAGRDHSILGQGLGRVFCIEAGAYRASGMQWPTVSANAQNTGVYGPPSGSPGDLNADSEINAGDLILLRQLINNPGAATNVVDPSNGDLDGVPGITEADFNVLVDMVLGIR